jgi:hypothetical protein
VSDGGPEALPLLMPPPPRAVAGQQLITRCLHAPAQAQACQLAVEYLAHLKGAHLRMIASHQHAVQRASRWAAAAAGLLSGSSDWRQH